MRAKQAAKLIRQTYTGPPVLDIRQAHALFQRLGFECSEAKDGVLYGPFLDDVLEKMTDAELKALLQSGWYYLKGYLVKNGTDS